MIELISVVPGNGNRASKPIKVDKIFINYKSMEAYANTTLKAELEAKAGKKFDYIDMQYKRKHGDINSNNPIS